MIGLWSIGTMVSGAGSFQPKALCGRTVLCHLGDRAGDKFKLRPELRRDIAFSRQDIRTEAPDAKFDLALWRNLVFTYFDAPTQSRLLDELRAHMWPGGALVIGAHEKLPMSALGGAARSGVLALHHLWQFRIAACQRRNSDSRWEKTQAGGWITVRGMAGLGTLAAGG